MPPSVMVLSSAPEFFTRVSEALQSDERFVHADGLLHCDGAVAPLSNLYVVDAVPAEWEDWESSTVGMPDPLTMTHVVFECRSPQWVVEVCALIAEAVEEPVWVVDAADAVWPADQVDPAQVRLS